MKRKILSFINRCLAGVLAVLGFQTTGCAMKYGVMEPTVEYGSPWADYKVQGKVTDQEQAPLKDIQVVLESPKYRGYSDTLYTDENGEYKFQNYFIPTDSVSVTANDTAGVYASESKKEALSYDRKDADTWYRGVGSAEVNFELKEK